MKKLSLLFFVLAFALSSLVMACGSNAENSKPASETPIDASQATSVIDENVQADNEEDCEKCKKGEKHEHDKNKKEDCEKCKKGEKHEHDKNKKEDCGKCKKGEKHKHDKKD